ncbi:hypothetical protein [Ramlibacter alkalitolerans]|uniref:DUF4230 domain-containing protein n=1 Tax=Ramlibacter alkalitolerans TaxID=2039631 RepID=A0ABS1JWQ8_9BURK|nr:hypothetical protein [Ramlibacter alkalitolerans]MBL0428750.1 hypothetical protein [Ramlibacter alkalitolerans]
MTRSYWPPAGTLIGIAVLAGVGYGNWKFEGLQDAVLHAFRVTGRASTEVSSLSGTQVMRTPGGLLEVARIKAYERITRTDPKRIGEWLDLGTTVSEIDVAVLFRYHIEMAKEWPITCSRGTCVVRAGRITPTLPPAIYTDEMRKHTSAGWARFNKQSNLAALEKSLTAELAARATSERNVAAATEAGRKTVEEFVRTWVKTSLPSQTGPVSIVVLFPGETNTAKPSGID